MKSKIDAHACDLTEMLLRLERLEREADRHAKAVSRTRGLCKELLMSRKLKRGKL